jgi:DNA-3-methyladenine glycosylase
VSAIERAAPLPVSFFQRPVAEVAQDLLGRVLVSRLGGALVAGRIVETEAYLGAGDPASHAWKGRRTPRNEALFGTAGTWYVYRSYGMHWCANLVTAPADAGGAVLLRAVEPVAGLEEMRRRRGGTADRVLCAGPGRLAQSLAITRAVDGMAQARATGLWVVEGEALGAGGVERTPRIGITRAADWPLRFAVAGTRWASRPPRVQRMS